MTTGEAQRNDDLKGLIRYSVTPWYRSPGSTLQPSNASTRRSAMTIIELLVVILIILILAGLVLSVSSYVQQKGARARAESEIAAMSAALESYKADNGIYPTDTTTQMLAPNADPQGGNPGNFVNASQFLYKKLSGDSDGNPTTSDAANDTKSYFSFKPNMLKPNPAGPNTYIRDPFGNAYGYSTFENVNPGNANGNNPTFDLWSTCGETAKKSGETFQQYQQRWIKNW